jgi:hypothetical protein
VPNPDYTAVMQVEQLAKLMVTHRTGTTTDPTDHLLHSTPIQGTEAARGLGAEAVWDQMVAPLVSAAEWEAGMNKLAITAEAATANNDFARLSSGHVVRVYGNGRCPLCLRRRLRASDVREIECGFAWTCSACHRDVVIVSTE